MAGAHTGISIEIDDREARAALARLATRAERLAPALAEIGEALVQSTQARFVSETAPDGAPWAANTPATRARKRNPRILTEDGYLGDLIAYDVDSQGLRVGSNRDYAATHQFGAKRGAFGTSRRGRPIPWGDIDARPFLGLSAADRDHLVAIVADYLAL